MHKCYFELRKQSARGTDSIAASIMRHLHTRQHLGKAVIICEQPTPLLSASRKQWLKLSRNIQKQRASTLNADKILKHTHTITHMQHMRFSSKPPLEEPEADIFFLTRQACGIMPLQCFSVYIATTIDEQAASLFIGQIPAEALVVDYCQGLDWPKLGLQPKHILEEQVTHEWNKIQEFMQSHNIDITQLLQGYMQNIEAMDNALDALLEVSNQFLRIANDFQRTLEMARPIKIERYNRQKFDSVLLLAYRVQALSPGVFTQHFLETYNEDDTFFLYDTTKQYIILGSEPLADAVARHTRAGRVHLAHALRTLFAAKTI